MMMMGKKWPKKNSARPAAGRPEAGSEIHIVLALGPAGQIFGSELHIVRSSLGPHFQPKSFNLHGLIRVWLQNRGQISSPGARTYEYLSPGLAGRRPAECFFYFFSRWWRWGWRGPRLGGMQAPSPPRERGQSVVNNYVKTLLEYVKGYVLKLY